MMTAVLFLIRKNNLNEFTTPIDWFQLMVWPTSFWFVSAIFFDGVLVSILKKIKAFGTKPRVWFCLVLLALVDVAVYVLLIEDKAELGRRGYKLLNGSFYYKCIYSFIVFLLGYLVKEDTIRFPPVRKQSLLLRQTMVSLVIFYGFKAGLKIGIIPMQLQLIS